MTRKLLIAALLMSAGASAARAQIGVGAGVTPDSFGYGAEERRREALPPIDPGALATSLAFDATTWTAVQLSTAPAKDLTSLMRKGYYRLELVQMILLAKETKSSLKSLAEDREKGKRMREMAGKRGADYESIYDRSQKMNRSIEDVFLPAVMSVSVSTSPARARSAAPVKARKR